VARPPFRAAGERRQPGGVRPDFHPEAGTAHRLQADRCVENSRAVACARLCPARARARQLDPGPVVLGGDVGPGRGLSGSGSSCYSTSRLPVETAEFSLMSALLRTAPAILTHCRAEPPLGLASNVPQDDIDSRHIGGYLRGHTKSQVTLREEWSLWSSSLGRHRPRLPAPGCRGGTLHSRL
jgi:hypothetical protein